VNRNGLSTLSRASVLAESEPKLSILVFHAFS
jgi:hypothetical protein